MLHININNENYILKDSDEEIFFFSETKYFLLITDDTTRKHWIYFLKKKSDLFDVLIFFFNYLKNLNIQFSVILKSDWANEILNVRIQTKLFKKIWIKTINSVIFLTNILLTLTELFSEFIKLTKKIEILWETWENISYNFQKNIQEIDVDVYVQIKDFKLKKVSKLLF